MVTTPRRFVGDLFGPPPTPDPQEEILQGFADLAGLVPFDDGPQPGGAVSPAPYDPNTGTPAPVATVAPPPPRRIAPATLAFPSLQPRRSPSIGEAARSDDEIDALFGSTPTDIGALTPPLRRIEPAQSPRIDPLVGEAALTDDEINAKCSQTVSRPGERE